MTEFFLKIESKNSVKNLIMKSSCRSYSCCYCCVVVVLVSPSLKHLGLEL